MRVVMLAAGAGGMICGSCLRDNRLAATLRRQGRDVLLLPLYTPLRTDEPSVAAGEVEFGGIGVWLAQRGGLAARLGRFLRPVLSSARLLRLATREVGSDPAHLGPLTISVLEGARGPQQAAIAHLVETLRGLRPDVVHLPNLMFAGFAPTLRDALGVRVACTLGGEDLFLDGLPQSDRVRCTELIAEGGRAIDAYLGVTDYYARYATERFALPPERVFVTPLGIAVEDFQRPHATPNRTDGFALGYLARIAPEKGLAALVDGVAALDPDRRASLELRIAGYRNAAGRRFLARELTRAAGAGVRVTDQGELDRPGKLAFLHSLDAFCVPSVYAEAKGLYVLEALAAGVPVVQPDHGAFPEILAAAGGGLLYRAGDAAALAAQLARLMSDPALRAQLAAAGAAGVRAHYTDQAMADATWTVYERLSAPAAAGQRVR